MNQNRPVYRHPPRSHAYSCRCPRCAQFNSRPLDSGAWIWIVIPVVAGFFWVLSAPLRIWHTIGADGQEHPDAATYVAYAVPAALIVGLLMFFSIRSANRSRPPKGRLRVETTAPVSGPPMTSMPPTAAESRAMAPAICLHRKAVPVDNLLGGEPWAWLCPKETGGCGAELPADWKPAPAPPPPPVAVPAVGWSWEWHCTCGRARTGHTRTQAAAQAAINRGVAAHQGYGHRYEYRWWPGIG